MRAQRCTAYLFLFLFLLTNLTNGEGTTPPRLFLTRFDAFRRERGGFNPLPPCFRRVSTQPERVQPLVVFDALASAQRRNEEGFSLLVTSIWPTRRRRGLIPPRLFSTCFDANGDGVNPFPFFFDVFRRNRGWFNPSSFVFDVFQHEWGGHQPSLFTFDVPGCFNTSWHFVFCFL